MDRIQQSDEKYQSLYGDQTFPLSETDPDFAAIQKRFVFGEIASHGDLSDSLRELISLVVLATQQNIDALKAHAGAALIAGATPVELKEALYQCAPYIGFPRTILAVRGVNEVLDSIDIELPVESQAQVDESNRLEKGLAVQKSIFGEVIDKMRAGAPEELMHIQDYLSAYCFGDIYTRSGLDLKTREILTLCILLALGGCESQVKSHMMGNVSVGNSRETLIGVITQCMPLVGFPRTLNAFASLAEVLKD